MSENAKNQLLEILKNLGCLEEYADFQTTLLSPPPNSQHSTVVTVTFPDGRIVKGTGKGQRKVDAELIAAQTTIDILRNTYPELLVNWDEIFVEAQAGDALIKLGVYLSASLRTASEKSKELQSLEADQHLAKVFEQWKAKGDPDLAIWGSNLGEKKKATLVESLLWRRYGKQIMADDAPLQLQSLLKNLQ
ncbi:hypothetical protein NDI45_08225 [Leptolyngbya sp. GB1-A1]|uniref:putative dsRNA-binding protein n=1 Tax=Leptolyngbya sp. GB1-A1 TaxID=2933908 RepID=UPI00329A7379